MYSLFVILTALIVGLIGGIVIHYTRRYLTRRNLLDRARIVNIDRIECLNNINGGDWYYDPFDKKYKDFMTDREYK